MRYTSLIFLLLLSLLGHAQGKRVYYVGTSQIAVENSDGSNALLRDASAVQITSDAASIVVGIGGAVYSLSPAQFLNKSGLAYSSASPQAAKDAFFDSAPTASGGGSGGTTSVTVSTTATVGTIAKTALDYSGSSTIATSDAFRITLYNAGSANGTFTYAGLSYTLLPGDTWAIELERDPVSGKLVPFSTLTVDGTGTFIRVSKSLKQ